MSRKKGKEENGKEREVKQLEEMEESKKRKK